MPDKLEANDQPIEEQLDEAIRKTAAAAQCSVELVRSGFDRIVSIEDSQVDAMVDHYQRDLHAALLAERGMYQVRDTTKSDPIRGRYRITSGFAGLALLAASATEKRRGPAPLIDTDTCPWMGKQAIGGGTRSKRTRHVAHQSGSKSQHRKAQKQARRRSR